MMKTLAILATLVATTTLAAAQPSVSMTAPAPEQPTDHYLGVGLEAGGIQGALTMPATLDGGYRLGDHLWAHGMVLGGRAFGVDEETFSGSVVQVRAGLEERACIAEALCALAGVDVGVSHTQFMAEYDHEDTTSPIAIARAGFDVGSRHVRVRPGVELGAGDRWRAHIALTGAVAYQW